MNEELLNTQIVKSSIKRYLDEGMSQEKILEKLEDIHLIFITLEELKLFISENKTKNWK